MRRGAELRAHAQEIRRRLAAAYPDAHCELEYRNPFELAVATVLSAQCTDKRVNMVTPDLFTRWPDAAALAQAPVAEIEDVIRSTGFFRNKAKSLSGLARAVVAAHDGRLPGTMDDLVALPGVGRKTANVVLSNAFGVHEGIVVDTHVARLAVRLGLTRATDPVRIERALTPLFDRPSWGMLSHLLIWHGRRVCEARKPRCGECTLHDVCPSSRT
ncbi:MAG: endonuclease III [Gemmatimonadota bacterium]|nr:endonuclease III [Gemmatimonadota bacterium]